MGDTVTCMAVLQKSVDPDRNGSLYLVTGPEGLRILPCHPEGRARHGNDAQWNYREDDETLHVHPSLLATDTGFHTDYNWTCQFKECPPGESAYDLFMQLNPGVNERMFG